jgi:Uma2 family endonuclease
VATISKEKSRAKTLRRPKKAMKADVGTHIVPEEPPVAQETLLTAEEYYATCHLENTELIDGKVITHMPPGEAHGFLEISIGSFLRAWARQHNAGRVYGETGFRLRRNPDTVRSPDVSFVETARLPAMQPQAGFIEGAPTLAVEIVSPGDTWREVESKTRLYLDCGVREVWIVEWESRTVEVRRPGEASHIYLESETLQSAVLPGLELKVCEIFE